jgi:hypothetical protein
LTFATVFLLDNSSRMVSAVFMPLLVILIEAVCPFIFYRGTRRASLDSHGRDST